MSPMHPQELEQRYNAFRRFVELALDQSRSVSTAALVREFEEVRTCRRLALTCKQRFKDGSARVNGTGKRIWLGAA